MMNSVNLVGRLTKEVDLKYTPKGNATGTFILAVNRNYTNANGEREADYIRCVIWRKAAETLAKFTGKGSLIGINGRLQTRSYQNQQGQTMYVTEVLVTDFYLLESKEVNEQRAKAITNNQVEQSTFENDVQISDSDLPF
ncbi:TPA: single-stranded DNA-binding protein [Enterococcus faecium]|uniref:single-stranded DNA-binding protein n=1 Tax=Enterococcus TaxID=1350 RepID=UPI0002A461C7|nr:MULTISPECIES: single-stranded DNA-binding protein [Enterococcus]ELB81158.1 single-strand binding protein [Enterococcus faecium EnGen0049]ELB81985.1 single-strand binding protein [Enterococcus faecium EnGen0045]MDN3139740.1 single-stranded DNA-binding protein [Enterococcus faecalis]MWG19275.1 single-stranded DNA-binding protein [Enterococcus faecium]HAQ6362178.1 single-stranded DNA-binding protein [Enterococcus faecium]